MIKTLKKLVAQSPILQVTSFNSLSVVLRLFTSLVISKLTAILFGTQGMALIGNLKNTLSVLQSFSTGGLNNGVVKYASENKDDNYNYKVFISTLLWLFIGLSIIIFFSVFFNSNALAIYVFDDIKYNFVFKWTAILLPLFGLNSYMLAILQGLEQFKKVIKINIFTHFLNVIVFVIAVFQFGLSGALMAVVIVPSASLAISLFLARKYLRLGLYFDYTIFSTQQLKFFGQYAFMSLISAVTFPLVYLGIRQSLTEQIGIDAAGYWEANFRLSAFYLVFIHSLLNLYILPKFVQAKSKLEFRSIVFEFYKKVLPFFGLGLIVLFVLRKYLVLMVFSEDFLEVTTILGWQMIADFLRVLAIVMVIQFHAKKMIWHYILTDLFLAVALYFSAIIGAKYLDLSGVVIGHVITYLLYFFVILIIFRKSLFGLKA
ncbi:O-antigen translocase [Flavobacteriaceae bacterium 14752]|uniref:O-antigen translocase n=1 Tax=Mesohalobacter salilacus TaxID=2491711 RepID=UPI000F634FCC|nr:O-antigen translocase [Flavobacteriaceae bacterium 14752]